MPCHVGTDPDPAARAVESSAGSTGVLGKGVLCSGKLSLHGGVAHGGLSIPPSSCWWRRMDALHETQEISRKSFPPALQ